MRKFSNHYVVYYEVFNKKNEKVCGSGGVGIACYSLLFRLKLNNVSYIIFSKFLEESSHIYAKDYIQKLCSICNYKVEFLEDDKIKVYISNNSPLLKIFCTLFRILWEGKGSKNMTFLKMFCENTVNVHNLLPRLCKAHNESKLWMGGGHGIKYNSEDNVLIKTKKQLHSYKPKNNYNQVQDFFMKD